MFSFYRKIKLLGPIRVAINFARTLAMCWV